MNSRKIVLKMLKVRGYEIPDKPELLCVDSEEYMTYKTDDPDDKLYIFFPKTPKVGVTTIRQYTKEMEEAGVTHAIIVVKESITAFAKQDLVKAKPAIIEPFKESFFLIDIMDHVLVPKHELLTPEEKTALLQGLKSKETQLPKIMSSDPVSRYFGARRGQVFKITRCSETAGVYYNYRIVV